MSTCCWEVSGPFHSVAKFLARDSGAPPKIYIYADHDHEALLQAASYTGLDVSLLDVSIADPLDGASLFVSNIKSGRYT